MLDFPVENIVIKLGGSFPIMCGKFNMNNGVFKHWISPSKMVENGHDYYRTKVRFWQEEKSDP